MKYFQHQLPDTQNIISEIGITNTMFITFVFGCIFALLVRKFQNSSDGPQYQNLLRNFEMQKGEYQYYLEKKMKIVKFQTRLKYCRWTYYTALAIIVVLCTMDPNKQAYLFAKHGWTTIPVMCSLFIALTLARYYYDGK